MGVQNQPIPSPMENQVSPPGKNPHFKRGLLLDYCRPPIRDHQRCDTCIAVQHRFVIAVQRWFNNAAQHLYAIAVQPWQTTVSETVTDVVVPASRTYVHQCRNAAGW